MSYDVPEIEPEELVAGETWRWNKILADYPASTWTLSYVFLLQSGTTSFTITTSSDGDTHVISVVAATTAAYTAGDYYWQAYVTDGTNKYLADRGAMTVLPDFGSETSDPRTHERIVLDALEACIENRATDDVLEMTMPNGKSLKVMSWDELIKARKYYRRLVSAQERSVDDPNSDRHIKYTFTEVSG